MRLSGPIAAVALALGVPAVTSAVAQTDMTTGRTVAAPIAAQDFVSKVVDGTQFELQSARIAVKRAQDPAVKDLAERLIRDHTSASDDLKRTVEPDRQIKIPKAPKLSADMQRKIDQLKSTSGSEFDRKFLDIMAADHEEDLELFRSYEASGSDPAIKDFARRTLPTIQNHMREVEKIKTPGKAG